MVPGDKEGLWTYWMMDRHGHYGCWDGTRRIINSLVHLDTWGLGEIKIKYKSVKVETEAAQDVCQ